MKQTLAVKYALKQRHFTTAILNEDRFNKKINLVNKYI